MTSLDNFDCDTEFDSDESGKQRRRVRPTPPSPPSSPLPRKLPAVGKGIAKPARKASPMRSKKVVRKVRANAVMEPVTEEEVAGDDGAAGPVVVQGRLMTDEEVDSYKRKGGVIISVSLPRAAEEGEVLGETQECIPSIPCTPVVDLQDEWETQPMPPPTLVGMFKGKCDICGLDVFSSQARSLVKKKYFHTACYSGPAKAGEQVVVKPVAVKPVVKGPCIICGGEVTSEDCRQHTPDGYLHHRCDPVKGVCPKCGEEVLQYAHGLRRKDGMGRYYHSGCVPAAGKAD
jgi:hypothetical protein